MRVSNTCFAYLLNFNYSFFILVLFISVMIVLPCKFDGDTLSMSVDDVVHAPLVIGEALQNKVFATARYLWTLRRYAKYFTPIVVNEVPVIWLSAVK